MGCGAIKVASCPAQDAVASPHFSGQVLPEPVEGKASASSSREVQHCLSDRVEEPEDEPAVADEGSGGNSPWSRSPKQRKQIIRGRSNSAVGQSRPMDDAPAVSEPTVIEVRPKAPSVSPESRRFLSKVMQKHFLFSGLEDDERDAVIDHMELQDFSTGQTIFTQGQKGDCCFVIQSGIFTVSIDDRLLKQLRPRHTFGELALLYNVSRTASVICSQQGTLWRLDEKRFRECVKTLTMKQLARVRDFLDADPTFGVLKEEERDVLAGSCSVQVFQRGEQILREGEVGDWMFVVIEGNVLTVDQYGNTVVKLPGTILGSTGLIYTKRQIFGAKAIDSVTCIALGKSSLERLIGPVENVLRRSAIKCLILDNYTSGCSGELDFFRQLSDGQQNALIDKFEDVSFDEGEVIVSPGARPQFIIIIEGEVGVLSDNVGVEAVAASIQVKEFAQKVLTSGMTYGAAALVECAAMKEPLVALSDVRMHRIGHDTLSAIYGEPLAKVLRLNEIKKVLSDVFLFKNLHEDQIDLTIRALEQRRYGPGEIIVEQGEDAKHFFLIQSGVITVVKDGAKLRTLGRWDYFGERGLLLQEKRSATCLAENTCTCLVLQDETFTEIVGMFRRDLEHRMYLQDLDITMSDLRLKAVVGRGTFGIVKLVSHYKDESKMYALKCVNKQQVVQQHQQKALLTEREINAQCYHPCVMQFIKTFQDDHSVYFLTEFLGGGDLFYAIREIGSLSKEQSQFFSGCISLALEYLHARGIMYRDLKPENVLLDFDGNAKLVDFGCCKKSFRTSTLVGTPEYLAPEVILGKGYTCSVDWWALGVMMHEFIVGPLPFGRDTEDQLELFREILEAALIFPQYVKDETAIAILSGLLDRSPEQRIGSSSRAAKELQEHRYFFNFDWRALAGHYMAPPWTPDSKKLQANWDMKSGEAIAVPGGAAGPPKFEGDMAWASVF